MINIKPKLKKLFLILGKAGTGKDAISFMTSRQLNIPIATSFTTRDRRNNEPETSYHFITQEEFDAKLNNGEIIEHTSYYIESEDKTYTYGLTEEELEQSEYVIAIVNPHGLSQILNSKYRDKVVTILLDCNDRERLLRYLLRDKNVNVEEMIDRYKRDKADFDDINGIMDYIVQNEETLDEALSKVKTIIEAEMSCE